MAQFSNAQVRQLYVVNAYDQIVDRDAGELIDPLPADGSVSGTLSADHENLWFDYVTPNGDNGNSTAVRSDLITVPNIEYVRIAPPRTRPLQRKEVVLDTSINTGLPVVGQEYILRFTFYNIGMGGPENQYIKEGGSYRVFPGDTAAKVYEELARLAKINFSREPYPYVHVYTDTYDPWVVGTDPSLMPGTSTKIIIEEVLQPWVLGKRQAAQVFFNVNAVPIAYIGTYIPWGTFSDTTATNTNVLNNGREIADMEWFYIGERADQFRGMGYPDNFRTKYLADESKKYYTMDISFFYNGRNEDIQRSTKILTFVSTESGVLNSILSVFSGAVDPKKIIDMR